MENIKEAIEHHQELCNTTRAALKDHNLLGPWMDEPDRVEFKAHGLDCLLVRNHTMFQWCGYVGVQPNHPNVKRLVKKKLQLAPHESEYLDDDNDDLEVHGGITYREECQGFICHITEEKDKLFWFGFDCAHFNDFSPGMELHKKLIREMPGLPAVIQENNKKLMELKSLMPDQFLGIYRDLSFVMKETKDLARQLQELR